MYAFIFIFLFLSVYTEVPLYASPTFFIPSFLTLASVPLLGVLLWGHVRRYDVRLVRQLTIIFATTALLSPGFAFIDEKLLGLLQTVVSVVAGILVLKIMERVPRRILTTLFMFLGFAMAVGAYLEVAGIVREASDAFRNTVYDRGGYQIYSRDDRDELLTGFIRPKLFTSEPSLLAIGFFVATNAWVILSTRIWTRVVAAALSIFMLAVTASPILLGSLFVTAIASYRAGIRGRAMVVAFGCVVALAALATVAIPRVFEQVEDRVSDAVENSLTLKLSSENVRITFPYITAVDVLTHSPALGVGISGKEVIPQFSSLPLDPTYMLGTNNLAALLIYCGLLGTYFVIRAFCSYLASIGVKSFALVAVTTVVFSQMMGGFETPRMWAYLFVLFGAIAISDRTQTRRNYQVAGGGEALFGRHVSPYGPRRLLPTHIQPSMS